MFPRMSIMSARHRFLFLKIYHLKSAFHTNLLWTKPCPVVQLTPAKIYKFLKSSAFRSILSNMGKAGKHKCCKVFQKASLLCLLDFFHSRNSCPKTGNDTMMNAKFRLPYSALSRKRSFSTCTWKPHCDSRYSLTDYM